MAISNPENPSNSTLLYNTLVQGLLRPDVRYTDGHYLDVTLPPDGEYPGATGWVSDYEAYKLQAAHELDRQRKEAWGEALNTDNPLPFPMGLLRADRRALLERGLTYIDIKLEEPSDGRAVSYSLLRPREVQEDFLPPNLDAAGIEPTSEEILVWDIKRRLQIPNPFTEPHLLALYKYLQQPQA
ncbi:MAG TPA: hypothetical protein VLG11_00230 [Candidatus Saccharimonadales bacterium]|nr:hypothetical protein [Candidatus Saccharimonadales bacterium]